MLSTESAGDRAIAVRSWLYAPGHSQKLVGRVFEVGADAVVLDLEDGVPPEAKDDARALVATTLEQRAAWVRINAARTDAAAADLESVAAYAIGIRVPKVESADDVAWVVERAPGVALSASIESARGLLAATEIAAAPGVALISIGLADLALDLGVEPTSETFVHARGLLVVAARAAGIDAPVDGVYIGPDEEATLRAEASRARDAGFFGKAVVRPWQVPVVNVLFSTAEEQLDWARAVVAAFEGSRGEATRLASGELVDLPIVLRARRLLEGAP